VIRPCDRALPGGGHHAGSVPRGTA
jgi:hypothetical protein